MINNFLTKHRSEDNSFLVILDIQKEQEGIKRRLEQYSNFDQVEKSKLEQYLTDLDKFKELITAASGDVVEAIDKFKQ